MAMHAAHTAIVPITAPKPEPLVFYNEKFPFYLNIHTSSGLISALFITSEI